MPHTKMQGEKELGSLIPFLHFPLRQCGFDHG